MYIRLSNCLNYVCFKPRKGLDQCLAIQSLQSEAGDSPWPLRAPPASWHVYECHWLPERSRRSRHQRWSPGDFDGAVWRWCSLDDYGVVVHWYGWWHGVPAKILWWPSSAKYAAAPSTCAGNAEWWEMWKFTQGQGLFNLLAHIDSYQSAHTTSSHTNNVRSRMLSLSCLISSKIQPLTSWLCRWHRHVGLNGTLLLLSLEASLRSEVSLSNGFSAEVTSIWLAQFDACCDVCVANPSSVHVEKRIISTGVDRTKSRPNEVNYQNQWSRCKMTSIMTKQMIATDGFVESRMPNI